MFKTEYWTHDDSLLMTADEIEEFNRDILSDEGMRRFLPCSDPLPNEVERRDFVLYNLGRKEYADFAPGLSDNVRMGLEGFGEGCRFGICIMRTAMQSLPLDGDWSVRKSLTLSPLHLGGGVVIYSATEDGKWLFVRSEVYYGWVKSECIALCHNREELKALLDYRSFLVVTAESLYLSAGDKTVKCDMGDRIELLSSDTNQNKFAVSVFEADASGFAVKKTAELDMSEDVSVGYLPYTKRRFLDQCFKCTDTPYLWGGGEGARDCSSFIMELFACFGLVFPRNSARQAMIPAYTVDLSSIDDNGKGEALASLPVGALIFSPKHIMINLGEREKEHYILHNSGDFGIVGTDEKYFSYGVTVSSLERTQTFSGRVWLSAITKSVIPYVSKKYSVLVNRERRTPTELFPESSPGFVKCFDGRDITLEKKTAEAYLRLKEFLESLGIFVCICSGYRSIEYQKTLCGEYAAEPGYSEHHTGLALDLAVLIDGKWLDDNESEAERAVLERIHPYLHLFGFVLRYPKGKENITGYKYEPWHLRYVGTDAARVLYNGGENLCLEELIP